jgi:FAD/FMN-containing dehydrogenase
MTSRPTNDRLVDALRDVVGDVHVLVDSDVTAPFCVDWTGRFRGTARAVVRPGSTEEVAAVVTCCARLGVGIVTQGGNTGLVGGSVPRSTDPDLVVLSTRRLTSHGPVDATSRQVTVGAGMTIADLHRLAADSGLEFGVDLAARDSATVGGAIATNAGGLRVVLHGDMRRQIVGLEVVFADGSVGSHLNGLPKDSAGFDIGQLIVGSEGTLGVVTRARLRLVEPLPEQRSTALLGLPDVDTAIRLARAQPGLLAAEFMGGSAMDMVVEQLDLPFPLAERWPFYAVLETVDLPELPDDVDAALDRRVWVYRERQTEAAGLFGVVHKLDVGVPLDRLGEVLDRLPDVAAPCQAYAFGHLLEGNIHVEVVGADPDDHEVDASILRLVTEVGGSVSAEHGIGRAKVDYLPWTRSAAELAAMRAVKTALDPDGRMNPGVLLSDAG